SADRDARDAGHRAIVPQTDRGFTLISLPGSRAGPVVTLLEAAYGRPMALRTLVLFALAAACAAGCGSAGTKAGAGTGAVISLKMQAPDGDDADAAYFADEVRRRTAGRVRIEIDGHSYSSVDPDNELRLIRDLRAGRVATAYVPSRAWERAGLPGFRALQAPFLIDDYGLLKDVATGEVGARMLASLDKAGLVGLGL